MNLDPTTTKTLSSSSFANKMLGLSLIELMIGLTISSILMIGVSSIYFNSRETDKFTSELSRIQETGRHAIEFLARDIRMVGYQGCLDPQSVEMNNIALNPPTTDFFGTALRGFEVDDNSWANGTEFDNTAIEADALIGSDVIAIQGATVANTQLTGNMAAINSNIQINNNEMGLTQEDIVVIADCDSADMFRITNAANGGGDIVTLTYGMGTNSDNRLSAAYNTDAQIMFFESVAYYIADTGRVSSQGHPINALYRFSDIMANNAVAQFTSEELIEGVESMQILYGERLPTGDPDVPGNLRYSTADNVGNMESVESIQLGLLVSGSAEVLAQNDESSYLLPGETIAPDTDAGAEVTHAGDRRLRREYTITINLRNRR